MQIRRYVYRDVVKVCDVQHFLDTSGIQTYTVNHAQAIFLSAKDKAQVGPYYRVDSSSSCITCHRGLRNGCQYCSLACKVRLLHRRLTMPPPLHNHPRPACKPRQHRQHSHGHLLQLAATEGIPPPEPSKEQRTRAPKPVVKPQKTAPRPLRCLPGCAATSLHPSAWLRASMAGAAAARRDCVAHGTPLS